MLGAAIAALLLASPALAKPPVWIVRDGDSEVVLFGSVHVLPPGLDWQPDALKAALADADDLWFELPMDPAAEAQIAQIAQARGVMTIDKSLIAMLSPKGRERLSRACMRFHLSPGLMDRFEPWLAEVALASAQFRDAGADAESGVEKTVQAEAPAGAQRRAFETVEQQIEMFDGAPLADQLASLEESLRELDHDPKGYDRLVGAWMAGDVKGLEKDALEPLRKAAPEIYRRVVLDRNAAWTRALDARLKAGGRTAVVVGVGHLVGAGGVPARLRALGYSVEGP
ncbi:MAG TPA: TraB/GumN family protein [Phenylobacterium sp.]|nr:TraB/GumN family protein [Phenylobacterium sp.]